MLLSYTVDILSAIYLICFGLGLVMSIGSLLLGGLGHDVSGSPDAGIHGAEIHIPHDLHNFHASEGLHTETRIPLLSMNTILAFLLGFGAAGFSSQQLLKASLHYLSLVIALPVGFVFASIIYLVLSKILMRGQSAYLNDIDFDLRGIEGSVSSGLYSNHLGEVSYILNQSVESLPAKDRDNRSLPKGTPIIILAVHQGVATVLPLEEFKQHISQKEE